MSTQYERIKERFNEYLAKGINCLISYHSFPLKTDLFEKLKKDGFTLKPYYGKNGIFVEITKD